jgi:hypothetical protein
VVGLGGWGGGWWGVGGGVEDVSGCLAQRALARSRGLVARRQRTRQAAQTVQDSQLAPPLNQLLR